VLNRFCVARRISCVGWLRFDVCWFVREACLHNHTKQIGIREAHAGVVACGWLGAGGFAYVQTAPEQRCGLARVALRVLAEARVSQGLGNRFSGYEEG